MNINRIKPDGLLSVVILAGWLFALPAGAQPILVWTDQHDGGAQYHDDGYRVLVAADGHVIVGGEASDPGVGIDMFIRKLDRTDGHQMWGTRYEGYDSKDLALSEMTWDSVGQLLVAGYIRGCVG